MSGKRKLPVILLLTAAICLSAIPAYAAEAAAEQVTAVEQTAVKSQMFTIDKAIEYAKEHSRTMAAVKAAEATAKAQKEETRRTSKDTRNSIYKSDMGASSDGTYLIITGYTYKAAVFAYAAAQRSTVMQEYLLESQVKSAFYTYISNEKQAEIAKSSRDSANERLSHAELKYSMGSISQIELEQFRLAAIEAENSYNAAIRTKDLSMIQLKSTLNYPQSDELYVSGSIEATEADTTLPEEALKKSENSIAMVNAKESFELAGFKREKGIAHYTSGSVGANSIKAEYSQAELDYYNTVENQRITVYSAYNSMVSAYETLDYSKKSLEVAEKSLEAAKRSFELGLTTADEYLSAVQNFDTMKNRISSAELNAYLAKVNYKLQYDCQNTITQEDATL